MKTWRIPVTWESYGTIYIEADTLSEAMEIAKDERGVIPLPDTYDYVDESWQVSETDLEFVRCMYNDNQEDTEFAAADGTASDLSTDGRFWTNGLVSLEWYNTRLDLIDSDGNLIDYIFDYGEYNIEKQKEIIQDVKNMLDNRNEAQTCEVIRSMFVTVDKMIPLYKNITLEGLKNFYGEEWVCRVGNTAIIIK